MNVNLKDIYLFKEYGEYFLHAEYEMEDDKNISRFIFPKVRLPIRTKYIPDSKYDEYYDKASVDLGFGFLDAFKCDIKDPREGKNDDCKKAYYAEYIMETKVKKMTLSEIEKKLGHKIELISED